MNLQFTAGISLAWFLISGAGATGKCFSSIQMTQSIVLETMNYIV